MLIGGVDNLVPSIAGGCCLAGFTLALLYNGAYWQQFGINILEFSSISDIVKMSVIPIITSLLGFAAGIVIGEKALACNSGGRK